MKEHLTNEVHFATMSIVILDLWWSVLFTKINGLP